MKNIAVHNELYEVFQIIREREPDNELIRFLIDMLDAGDVEKGEGGGVWIAAADTRFSTERFSPLADATARIALTSLPPFRSEI